ncbi:MAG TPA: serine hydrolase domain-containing protein [Chloroflexia bacterium]|nr:serine hydrolase domain-containing protein [Chloroflexia bacterium]
MRTPPWRIVSLLLVGLLIGCTVPTPGQTPPTPWDGPAIAGNTPTPWDDPAIAGDTPTVAGDQGSAGDTPTVAGDQGSAEDTPPPAGRQWTVQGPPVTQLAALDGAMQTFMQATGTRAGSLAVAKDGQLLFAHGYTWADADYPRTQPTSLFRLASVSKTFTAAGITHAYATHLLTPTTRVFPLLGITTAALPTQQPDPRINTITVQQLVDHSGGWDDTAAGSGFDPVIRMRDIALALQLDGPPTGRDLARYMYGEPLQFAPGSKTQYSNFGYTLLGLVIEQVSGQSFADYLQQQVLAPLGITDVALAHTLADQQLPGEVSYDQSGTGLSPLDPNTELWVPLAYGGEGWLTEVSGGSGGLVASAPAVTALIHHYAVWGSGPRPSGPGPWESVKTGGMAGTSSRAVSRSDGLDYTYIFNTRDFPDARLEELNNALDAALTHAQLP